MRYGFNDTGRSLLCDAAKLGNFFSPDTDRFSLPLLMYPKTRGDRNQAGMGDRCKDLRVIAALLSMILPFFFSLLRRK